MYFPRTSNTSEAARTPRHTTRQPFCSYADSSAFYNLQRCTHLGNLGAVIDSQRTHNGRHSNHEEAHRFRQQEDLSVCRQEHHGQEFILIRSPQPQIHGSARSVTKALSIPRALPRPARLLQVRSARLPLPRLQRPMLQRPVLYQTDARTGRTRTATALVPRRFEEVHDS
jgi:hypothetical protein